MIDSKKGWFISGMTLVILGCLFYVATLVTPIGTLGTPGWELYYPALAWLLGGIILAITPFKKVNGKCVFNDVMSLISFAIIGVLLTLVLLG